MNVGRAGARTALSRSARVGQTPYRGRVRFQSTRSSWAPDAGRPGNSHLIAGAAGGVAAGVVLYAMYLMTPAGKALRTINKAAKEINQKYQEAAKKLQGQTPGFDDAIQYMKDFLYSYVSWVPGGRAYVDTVFKDVETLKENHREEVNQIVSDAYRQLQDLSRSGLSMETATRAYSILTDVAKRFGDLAGDALDSILDNHPQVKEKFGGSIEQLKEMGENYGPEAKKQVEETWKEAKEILGGGLSVANLNKVRSLFQDKLQIVQKLGDEVWNKALEEAKPYLSKNSKVKELIEKNASVLKKGNAKELFEEAKKAIESGNTSSLEEFINKAKSRGSQSSSMSFGLDQYFTKMIPNGSEILEKAQQLKEVAENHTEEGEKLLRETMEELKQVLEKKSERAKQIVEKAKRNAK
ncbi:hypothetical protein GGR57DRAFT_447895 [Xylariaceae sp. FL1272]|nr:hypothetical protein GGR57DRAFT_447895 [Xylariaceae sp. FL1272]